MKFFVRILFCFFVPISISAFAAEMEISPSVYSSDSSTSRQSAKPIVDSILYKDDAFVHAKIIDVRNGSIIENVIMRFTIHEVCGALQETFDGCMPSELSKIIAEYATHTNMYVVVEGDDKETYEYDVEYYPVILDMVNKATRNITASQGHFKFAKPIDAYSYAQSRADTFETLFRTNLYTDLGSNIISVFDMTSNTEIVHALSGDASNTCHDKSSNIIPFSINGKFYIFKDNTFSIFDDFNDLLAADITIRSFFKDKKLIGTYLYTLNKDPKGKDSSIILVRDTRTNTTIMILEIGREPFQADLVDSNLLVTCKDSVYMIRLDRLQALLYQKASTAAAATASSASAAGD